MQIREKYFVKKRHLKEILMKGLVEFGSGVVIILKF
jgi:hypothetical protein